MIFQTQEDIHAPIGQVFPLVSDFAGFERAALRRGAEVLRKDNLREPGPGMKWDLRFDLRGKRRDVELEMAQYDPPQSMRFFTYASGVEGVMTVDLIELSRNTTRLVIRLEMRANTLTGKLLLQSLKLAKGTLVGRVESKMYDFARGTEKRLGLA